MIVNDNLIEFLGGVIQKIGILYVIEERVLKACALAMYYTELIILDDKREDP